MLSWTIGSPCSSRVALPVTAETGAGAGGGAGGAGGTSGPGAPPGGGAGGAGAAGSSASIDTSPFVMNPCQCPKNRILGAIVTLSKSLSPFHPQTLCFPPGGGPHLTCMCSSSLSRQCGQSNRSQKISGSRPSSCHSGLSSLSLNPCNSELCPIHASSRASSDS